MKTNSFIPVISITCMACLLLPMACEKVHFKTSDPKKNENGIVFRGDECEMLCDDDCCCFVELDGDDATTLQLCGTSNGVSFCSGDQTCGTAPSDGSQVLVLSTMTPKKLFCMLDGDAPFWIKNLSTTDDADIIMDCIFDSETPIEIHLEPEETMYFETVSDCEVDPC